MLAQPLRSGSSARDAEEAHTREADQSGGHGNTTLQLTSSPETDADQPSTESVPSAPSPSGERGPARPVDVATPLLARARRGYSPELERDVAIALDRERERAVAAASAVRSLGSVAFVLLVLVPWVATGSMGWGVYVVPLTFYAVASTILFLLRRHKLVQRMAWVVVLLDVWLVGFVQLRTMPLSHFPAGVAGFSLGLFALLVVLNAMTFSGLVIYIAAAASIVAQGQLMHAADVGTPAIVAAALVLLLEARVLQVLTGRLRAILEGLASTAVESELERRKSEEIELGRQRIESLLADSREQNEQLRQLQEDKERLTQLLVHDLRSPLAVISGSAEVMEMTLRGHSALDEVREDLDMLRTTVGRLTGLTEDILRVSKLEDGTLPIKRERVQVRQMLVSVGREVERLYPHKELSIEVVAADDLVIDADLGLLTRAVENLATNAARFTPARHAIRLAARREANTVRIGVHNQGDVIDPELRARLFEKYQQAAASRGGWGLGLYFCRLAVEGHGGHIALEDVPDWATSFVLSLPAPAR